MMKNWKKIIILGIVLVIFVAAFIILSNLEDANNTSDNESETKEQLVEVKREDIETIILKHDESEIILSKEEIEEKTETQKDDGTTEVTTQTKEIWVASDFEVDTSRADDIALAAETTTINRTIDEEPDDLSVYGLDNYRLITFVLSNGNKVSIEIGNKSPTNNSYYVRRAGQNAVYTIDSYKGDTFCLGKFDLMNKNFYESDKVAGTDISSLSFIKNGEKRFRLEIRESGEWYMTYPIELKADTMEMPKFFEWLANMRASDFVEENPSDLNKYGLDSPSYIFNYTLSGKPFSLKLGAKIEDDYYAQMEDDHRIFTVSGSNLNFVDLPVIDLVQPFIFIPSIYDVEKLVIEMDGRVDTLLIDANKDDADKEKFYFNGQKIENENTESLFRGYYQGAIGIIGDRLDLDAKPKGNAQICLTYTMREAKPDKVVTVELIPTGDGYGYYLMKNGKYSGLVMGKRYLNNESMGIRPAYEKLIANLSESE